MEETNTTELYLDYMDYEYVYNGTFTPCQLLLDYASLITSFVCIVICLCGLVGNILVVWFLGFQMKKSPFTVYVLNLAIADFSLLLFLLARLVITVLYCILSLEIYNSIYYMTFLFLLGYFASMYLLTAISIERCLSVLFPIWYRCHRPMHLSGIVCGVLWALNGLLFSLLIISMFTSFFTYSEVLLYVSIWNSFIFSLLPLFSNLFLFFKLRCGSQRQRPGRLYIAILLSVILLFFFGFPLNVALLLGPFFLDKIYFYLSFIMASLNSSVNPFIYFLVGSWRKRRFQHSVKVAFQRVFEEKVTSEEENDVQGDTTAVTTL